MMKNIAVLMLLFVAYVTSNMQHSAEEGDLYEGDVVLSPDQAAAIDEQESKASGFAAMKSQHWKTNGKNDVIKYFIESSLTSEQQALDAIEAAVNDYHKYTCLRFERVYSKPSGTHMSFFKDNGCYSYVGRMSRENKISLGRGCWSKGTAMHEMGHALGFFHEQSRPDRDDHVEILYENIRPGMERNFALHKTDRIDSLGSPYDYESMMHYGEAYFKKSYGLITIRTKDPKYQNVIGQRGGFSQGDIEQFNKMYNCGNPSVATTKKPQSTTRKAQTTTRPTSGSCKDEYSSCSGSWKSICATNSFVQEHCKLSCNLCSTGPTTTKATTTTTTTTRAPTTTTTTKAPVGCVDDPFYASTCQSSWKNICSNSYVKSKCPATCNVCGTTVTTTPPASCVDKNTSCAKYWKNLCSTNSYVQNNCPKTCNRC